MSEGRNGPVRSVDRALSLFAMVAGAPDPLPLAAIASRAGLPKPTAYRLLETLRAHRLLRKDPVTHRYGPGLGLFEIAHAVLNNVELAGAAAEELRELGGQTNETVHLAILDEGDVVYVAKHESTQPVRMFSAVGRRGPAHCTGVGKALLGGLSPEELRRVIRQKGLERFTPQTITQPEALEEELEGVRARGYALDDQEHEPDIRCVAAPIRDHRGQVCGAVSLTIPSYRASREEMVARAPLVMGAAERISRKLGHVPTEGRR